MKDSYSLLIYIVNLLLSETTVIKAKIARLIDLCCELWICRTRGVGVSLHP